MDTNDNNIAKSPSTISRDIKLLIMGALISFISSISTTYINGNYENTKEFKNKKYAIIEQLSKDLGLRLYIDNELHRAISTNDQKQIDSAVNQYISMQKKFNLMNTIYEVQLSKFFSEENRKFYQDSVYYPLRDLGDSINAQKPFKNFGKSYEIRDNYNYLFVRKLYNTIN
jgi:hypothetical protein